MRKFLILLIGILCVNNASSQNLGKLDSLFETSTILTKHYVGFSLYDLNGKQFIFEKNHDKHFTPASNTKVFTLFAATKIIGDSIPTIAYKISGDSLIFWGTGDPTFLHPKFSSDKVLRFLKESNKKLYYAHSSSQEPFYRNGWAVEDYEYYYQPEISVLPLYGNVIRFDEKDAKLKLTPSYFERFIHPKADTLKRFLVHRAYESNAMNYNSELLPKGYINEKPFRVSDSLISDLLSDTLGVKVRLIDREISADAKLIYSSKTLDVIREMMLPSDNFIAEQLNMVASFVHDRTFRTKKLRQYMQDNYYRFLPDSILLSDGSGLSSYNKITPRSMVTLLSWIDDDFVNKNVKLRLFPAGGIEGTLKNVYPTTNGVPFVWAKTGTINSVHCQSGYIHTKKGNRLAFSFLNNNFIGSAAPVRREMVKIVTYIYENY